MKNTLLKETLEALKFNNKKEKNVLWVGNNRSWITWEKFKEFANKKKEPVDNLIVVGKDWWLERSVYFSDEGSHYEKVDRGWRYKKMPQKNDRMENLGGFLVFEE